MVPGDLEAERAKYVIAMDGIPDAELPDAADVAHAVCREAIAAGVIVVASGLVDEPASVVAPGGAVTVGTPPGPLGGFAILDVADRVEARQWASRFALACRCAQEAWAVEPDPSSTGCSGRSSGRNGHRTPPVAALRSSG